MCGLMVKALCWDRKQVQTEEDLEHVILLSECPNHLGLWTKIWADCSSNVCHNFSTCIQVCTYRNV